MTGLNPERSDRDGEIMTIAKRPVVTASLTTSVYDIIHIMAREGFRRIPIVDPRTKALQGIVTSTDVVDYLGEERNLKSFNGNSVVPSSRR